MVDRSILQFRFGLNAFDRPRFSGTEPMRLPDGRETFLLGPCFADPFGKDRIGIIATDVRTMEIRRRWINDRSSDPHSFNRSINPNVIGRAFGGIVHGRCDCSTFL